MYILLEKFDPFTALLIAVVAQTFRYVLIAGSLFMLFYIIKRQAWYHRKIQLRFPKKKKIYQELFYSCISIVILSSFGLLLFYARQGGYTLIYSDISEYGWLYFWLSIPLLLMIHDTYFYWLHRFMHLPQIYPWVHRVHHYSHNPSPWTSFSFHPLEGILEYGFVFVVFLIPFHGLALLFFATYSIVVNVLGHLGYEVFPRWASRWHNTSTHHNMHHQYVKCNYGLYFSFWDRVMGTHHPEYYQKYEEVKSRPRPSTQS